jgi:hypothetical protein
LTVGALIAANMLAFALQPMRQLVVAGISCRPSERPSRIDELMSGDRKPAPGAHRCRRWQDIVLIA